MTEEFKFCEYNRGGEMRKITVVCENQILLKHCNSAQYLSAASGTDYPWDLWASVISDKYQPGLVGFWFVFFFLPQPKYSWAQISQVCSMSS